MTVGRNHASDAKVGAFVVVALALLIAGSLWIVGSNRLAGPQVPFTVVLRDSAGITVGDRVRLAGVNVGRIRGIELHPEEAWPVVMKFSVDKEYPLRKDASATIATSGLMGASFLQILPGSPDAPPLEPGGTIRAQPSYGLEGTLAQVEEISTKLSQILDQTSSLIDQVATDIGPVLAQLGELLSTDNVDQISAILLRVRTTVDEVSPRIEPLLARIESLTLTVEGGVESLPELSKRVADLVADLESALGTDGERLKDLLEGAQTALGSADESLSVIRDNRAGIERTMRGLEETVANLRAFSEQIKQQPSSLIRSSSPRERRPGDAAGERGR